MQPDGTRVIPPPHRGIRQVAGPARVRLGIRHGPGPGTLRPGSGGLAGRTHACTPRIAGTANIRLKLTAQVFENPKASAVEIVSEKDAAVYARVFARHGAGPEHAAMVGDSVRSDILPALAAGATHLLLDNMGPDMLRQAVALVAGRVLANVIGLLARARPASGP